MIRTIKSHVFVVFFLGVLAGRVELVLAQSPNSKTRVTAVSSQGQLARMRAEVIQRMRESRERSEQLLAVHEEEQRKLMVEYEKRKELYRQGLIARSDLFPVERALVLTFSRITEVKKWIFEDEIAITEATTRDLPALGIGGFSESATLIRFNGAAAWTLADAPKIQSYFSKSFGRSLPISAYGQTPTHDRLRFDHRDALDVALHPDSAEGRSLLGYLRQANIPFIAFRNAVPGAATGAHIHIGRPSIRN